MPFNECGNSCSPEPLSYIAIFRVTRRDHPEDPLHVCTCTRDRYCKILTCDESDNGKRY